MTAGTGGCSAYAWYDGTPWSAGPDISICICAPVAFKTSSVFAGSCAIPAAASVRLSAAPIARILPLLMESSPCAHKKQSLIAAETGLGLPASINLQVVIRQDLVCRGSERVNR